MLVVMSFQVMIVMAMLVLLRLRAALVFHVMALMCVAFP